MSGWYERSHLTYNVVWRNKSLGLESAVKYQGHVRNLIDGVFPEEFLSCVSIVRKPKGQPKGLSVRLESGAHSEELTHRALRGGGDGRVTLRFAAALRRCLNELYPRWLEWHGSVTTEPPKKCPNDSHKAWHPYREEATFVPDAGLWRCLGCGWLLDSDGSRVREKYCNFADSPKAARKMGSYHGHE